MKTKQTHQKRAFTIIELLTVMSIIIVLIGMLVPALNQVRKFSMRVQQAAQLKAISAGLEMFKNDYDNEYPDSGALDIMGREYCGAMKLAEAMMGRDLLGFHPKARFREDARNGTRQLYAPYVAGIALRDNLKERKGTYIAQDNANAYRLANLYAGGTGGFRDSNDIYLLCDVFKRNINNGTGDNKIGMPVLYYKSDPAGVTHDPNEGPQLTKVSNGFNFYNIYDNDELVRLGKPEGGIRHTLDSSFGRGEQDFYEITRNRQIEAARRPFRQDSFILISAGWDGEYGTGDDVTNFDIK